MSAIQVRDLTKVYRDAAGAPLHALGVRVLRRRALLVEAAAFVVFAIACLVLATRELNRAG